MTDANKMIRTAADREAINMPVQGTAADILKYAMVDIHQQIQEK
jgi:DNA polymerase-1